MKISARGSARPWLLSVALAGAVGIGSLAATAAADDIVLKSSTPKNGAVLSKMPSSVRLTFSVKPSKPNVKVISPDGDNHTQSTRVSGRTVIATFRSGEKGRYKATYKVSSPDGDARRGTISFTVK
jgi:methionine-rich copper-binding protein CopC